MSTDTPPEKKPRLSPLLMGILIGVAASVGTTAATYMFVGPQFVRGKIEGVIAEAVGQAIECAVQVPLEGGVSEEVYVHPVANLMVNPSGGSGYLLASVALQVGSAEQVDVLAARDALIRDAILRILSFQTFTDLADPGIRGYLGEEIVRAVGETVPAVEVRRVLFPQFVLQR